MAWKILVPINSTEDASSGTLGRIELDEEHVAVGVRIVNFGVMPPAGRPITAHGARRRAFNLVRAAQHFIDRHVADGRGGW